MTENDLNNDQNQTDRIVLFTTVLMSVLLSRYLTQEEAGTFALIFPPMLNALPGMKR